MTGRPYVTTARCPDGVFYGAAWNVDGSLIAISDPHATRSRARRWALARLPQPEALR